MATNHTPNYGLSQWLAGDAFKREDFNADNLAIDAAIAAGPKVITGSYTGTGTYGSAADGTTLSFQSAPKILFVASTGYEGQSVTIVWGTGYPLVNDANSSNSPVSRLYAKYNGASITWYSPSSAEKQLNKTGYTYRYVAIL